MIETKRGSRAKLIILAIVAVIALSGAIYYYKITQQPSFTVDVTTPFQFYGQAKEDELMLPYFTNSDRTYLTEGTFIELGALDGVIFSNTKLYEDRLGWTGLLIEPQTSYYERLVNNRDFSTKVHAAICLSEGTIDIIGSGGMAGRTDMLHKDTMNYWSKTTAKPFKVPCGPISKYMKQAEIKRVDFFSLDVEGSEFEVLSTYPFATVPTYAILVELTGVNAEKCREILRQKGFKYIKNMGHANSNELWINEFARNSRMY